MTKFCDPEEYDFVPVKRMIDQAGIPLLALETDQQMLDYGQARSAVEAFRERLQYAH
jgi:benzoyl-CoA reductase/2-hydroxyglutaryl-CoA dehydratase subunit BcrC/BadD/HgdB